jgi:hemerythrin
MIEWNEEYSVGISTIDEEHKKFIQIINGVIAAKQHDIDSDKIEEMLNEIIDYAWKHFRTEESYMIEFNYPEYQYHKEEHYNFIHKMDSYFSRVASGDYQIAIDILEFLKQWLVKHIYGTDTKYIECFARNGLKE